MKDWEIFRDKIAFRWVSFIIGSTLLFFISVTVYLVSKSTLFAGITLVSFLVWFHSIVKYDKHLRNTR